jgi:hypothetical protein
LWLQLLQDINQMGQLAAGFGETTHGMSTTYLNNGDDL